MPVKAVIRRLRSVIEYTRVRPDACGQGHNSVERQIGKLGARDQFIRVVDVRSMVPAVMKAQCLGGNDGL